MKKWICYNLFGHDTDTFGMISGLSLVGFLVGCWVYLFVYIPFFTIG